MAVSKRGATKASEDETLDRSHRASVPRLPDPAAARRPRPRAHHLAVQPEGRRRQDDDDHQPRRRARRATAARCSRSTSTRRARCRPGSASRPTRSRRSTTCCSTRKRDPHEVDRAHARREPRRHPGEHRPLGRRGAPRQRGRARADRSSRALRKVSADYDVILIDCQPSLGLLTVNALTASHGVLIPLECEFFALRGVAMLIETIDKVRDRLNPTITLDGVLATMYDSRTLHSREVLERVVDAFGDDVLETVIGRTVKFPDASVVGHADHRVRARARRRPGLPAAGAGAGRPWRCRLTTPTLRRPRRAGRRVSGRARVPRLAGRVRRPVRPAADAALEARARHHRGVAVAVTTSSSPTCGSSAPTKSSKRHPSSSSSRRPCST